MKFDKLLKKINQDVLMGIVIGIMLVILACFFGFCYSPKRTLLEGMKNDDSNSSNSKNMNSEHQYYVTATAAMNSACSLENDQTSCNGKSFTNKNNGNKYSCTWNVTNNACNLDFEKATWDSWSSSKKGSLSPAKTSSSSSITKPSSTSKSGSLSGSSSSS